MKRVLRPAVVAVLSVVFILAGAAPAAANDAICVGTLSPGVYDTVIVPPEMVCELNSVIVRGDVKAFEGSSLALGNFSGFGKTSGNNEVFGKVLGENAETVVSNSNVLHGGLYTKGATKVVVCETTVTNGDIAAADAMTENLDHVPHVMIGHPFVEQNCVGNDIHNGSIAVTGVHTMFGISVIANTVSNGILVSRNSDQGFLILENVVANDLKVLDNSGSARVADNHVAQTIECLGNTPEESFVGGPNVAAKAEGQCFTAP